MQHPKAKKYITKKAYHRKEAKRIQRRTAKQEATKHFRKRRHTAKHIRLATQPTKREILRNLKKLSKLAKRKMRPLGLRKRLTYHNKH